MRGNGLKLCQGTFRSDIRKKSLREWLEALEYIAQGGGGIPVSGIAQDAPGCGTWGRGLELMMVGLDDLAGVSQP